MAGSVATIAKWVGLKGVTWKEVPPMIVLALCGLWILDWSLQYYRDIAPVSEYFEVRQLSVPNHTVGDNPVIAYDRKIHRQFTGDWVGEIQRIEDFQQVCSNAGRWKYDPESKVPEHGFTLDWFMDQHCYLPPGVYRLQSCWTVLREEAKPVEFCRTTDPFRVWDPKEILNSQEQQG